MKWVFSLTFLTQLINYILSQRSTFCLEALRQLQCVKLTGLIVDFDCKCSMDPLNSDGKSQIMATNRVYANEANMVMEQEISSRQEFENKVDLSFTKSSQQFLEMFESVTAENFTYFEGSYYFITLLIHEQELKEKSTKKTIVVTKGQTVKVSNSAKIMHEQTDKVKIAPYQSVRVQTYLETVNNRKIPFTAMLRVRAELAQDYECARIDSCINPFVTPAQIIKAKISRLNLNVMIVEENEYSVEYKINGHIIASYALNFIMKSENTDADQGYDFFNNIAHWCPVIIIISIIIYLIYYIIKMKLRFRAPQNPINAIAMTDIEN